MMKDELADANFTGRIVIVQFQKRQTFTRLNHGPSGETWNRIERHSKIRLGASPMTRNATSGCILGTAVGDAIGVA
ncbi:hypothetical protein RBWH47_05691 [Rhodopirellula baltica WH47]|uniref:Uncharacterized protein n=1 Tax=Rhodopirellula baltica WH47 TaxID=991778 RepID=F2AZH6_RHOBT|nr:hypothetical protein RBWH47_05691 [Rhodopirellula baltica WH47]